MSRFGKALRGAFKKATGSRVGRALIGGALAGPAGAAIGALTGGKNRKRRLAELNKKKRKAAKKKRIPSTFDASAAARRRKSRRRVTSQAKTRMKDAKKTRRSKHGGMAESLSRIIAKGGGRSAKAARGVISKMGW